MRYIKKFSQNKFLYISLALILLLYPNISARPAESEIRAIVTTVGIDRVEGDEMELTLNFIVPKTAGDVSANLHTVSEKGKTVDEAISKLNYAVGKWVGLAHCEAVVIGENLLNEDVTKYLDFFIRTNNLTTNSLLFVSSTTAKETLKLMANASDPVSQSIKTLIEYDDNMYLPIEMNIENFYRAYFSPQSVALIGLIGTKENTTQGGGSVQGSNSGASSSGDQNISSGNASSSNTSQSSTSPSGGFSSGGSKTLYNQNDLIMLKEGKKVATIKPNEKSVLQLLDKRLRGNFLFVSDVSIAELKNADVSLEVYDKTVKEMVFFNNGVPVYHFDVTLYLKFDEAVTDDHLEPMLDEITNFFYEPFKEKITSNISSDLSSLVQTCRTEQADLFAVYDKFNKYHNKEWKQFLKELKNEKDYLNYTVFQLKVTILNKL